MADCPGGIDFTDPDFAMTIRMTDVDAGPSRFSYSTDRGHTGVVPSGCLYSTNRESRHERTIWSTASTSAAVSHGRQAEWPGRSAAVRPDQATAASRGSSSPGLPLSRRVTRSCPPRAAERGSCCRRSAATTAKHWIDTYRSLDLARAGRSTLSGPGLR